MISSDESDMLTSTPAKNLDYTYTPSEVADIETCSTCSFVSSSPSRRSIRGGKKHNKNKKKADPIGGSLERMSDILKKPSYNSGVDRAVEDKDKDKDEDKEVARDLLPKRLRQRSRTDTR